MDKITPIELANEVIVNFTGLALMTQAPYKINDNLLHKVLQLAHAVIAYDEDLAYLLQQARQEQKEKDAVMIELFDGGEGAGDGIDPDLMAKAIREG